MKKDNIFARPANDAEFARESESPAGWLAFVVGPSIIFFMVLFSGHLSAAPVARIAADRAAIEREYREQVFVPCVVMIVVSSGGGTPAEVMAGRFFRNLNRTVQPEVDGIVDTVLAGYRNDPAGRQALYNELLADCIRDLIEDGQG